MSNRTCERGGSIFFLSLGVCFQFKNQDLPRLGGLSMRQRQCCFDGPESHTKEQVSLAPLSYGLSPASTVVQYFGPFLFLLG